MANETHYKVTGETYDDRPGGEGAIRVEETYPRLRPALARARVLARECGTADVWGFYSRAGDHWRVSAGDVIRLS